MPDLGLMAFLMAPDHVAVLDAEAALSLSEFGVPGVTQLVT